MKYLSQNKATLEVDIRTKAQEIERLTTQVDIFRDQGEKLKGTLAKEQESNAQFKKLLHESVMHVYLLIISVIYIYIDKKTSN